MTERRPRILVLGLGNDILGDDAVGLLAARRLRAFLPDTVDVIESGGAGLDLLDLLEGYDRALLLDSILTGNHPPGTILEFSGADFKKDDAPSPHYAGLPTVMQLAESLGIHFPTRLQIVAVEIENPYEVLEGVSTRVESALPAVIDVARLRLEGWLAESRHDTQGFPLEPTRDVVSPKLEGEPSLADPKRHLDGRAIAAEPGRLPGCHPVEGKDALGPSAENATRAGPAHRARRLRGPCGPGSTPCRSSTR